MGIAKGIGKATLWLADKVLGVTDVGFELAGKAAYSIGKATVNGAGTIMAKAPGVAAASITSHRAIQNPVMAAASGIKKVAPMLVKDELATSVYDPVKRKLIQKSGGLKICYVINFSRRSSTKPPILFLRGCQTTQIVA